jgi:hypothetical protein
MNFRWSIVTLALLLAGCDDGAPERQALATCQLNPHAKGSDGNWDDNYLQTCMQAKGFAEDDALPAPDNLHCGDYSVDKLERANCYRQDGPGGKWLSQFRQKPAD